MLRDSQASPLTIDQPEGMAGAETKELWSGTVGLPLGDGLRCGQHISLVFLGPVCWAVLREWLEEREYAFTLCPSALHSCLTNLHNNWERSSNLPKMAKLSLKSRTGCYQLWRSFFSRDQAVSLFLGREGDKVT